MNIVYSYLTHHVYNRNSKLDIFTGLKMSPYLFCLTFVTDKDSLQLPNIPLRVLFFIQKTKQMQALTQHDTKLTNFVQGDQNQNRNPTSYLLVPRSNFPQFQTVTTLYWVPCESPSCYIQNGGAAEDNIYSILRVRSSCQSFIQIVVIRTKWTR